MEIMTKFDGDAFCLPFWAIDLSAGIPASVREACRRGSILGVPAYGTPSFQFTLGYQGEQRTVGILWNPPEELPSPCKRATRRARAKAIPPHEEIVPPMYTNRMLWEQNFRRASEKESGEEYDALYERWSEELDRLLPKRRTWRDVHAPVLEFMRCGMKAMGFHG